jgi:hypothetical protein
MSCLCLQQQRGLQCCLAIQAEDLCGALNVRHFDRWDVAGLLAEASNLLEITQDLLLQSL